MPKSPHPFYDSIEAIYTEIEDLRAVGKAILVCYMNGTPPSEIYDMVRGRGISGKSYQKIMIQLEEHGMLALADTNDCYVVTEKGKAYGTN